jgi:hypothetical protein
MNTIKLPPLPLPYSIDAQRGEDMQAYATAAVLADRAQRGGPVAIVAEVHMSRYTLEWTNGPLPEKTPLYAFPTPKESALRQALEALERPRSQQSWYSRACTDADAAKALREAIYTTPQPERKPMDKEHRKAIIEAAINAHDDDGLLPDMERLSWVIDATEHHHGIKP